MIDAQDFFISFDGSGNLIRFSQRFTLQDGSIVQKDFAAADPSLQSVLIELIKISTATKAEKGL